MRKTFAILAALLAALAFAGCAPATFGVETDDAGVHAVAKNGAEGSGTGAISIGEGYGLCVNHIVNRGSFHVTATDTESGEVVFDEDLTDNILDMADVQGDFDVVVTAKGADGTVDVIAYDKEAQAQADATLGDALDDAEKATKK